MNADKIIKATKEVLKTPKDITGGCFSTNNGSNQKNTSGFSHWKVTHK